MEIVNIDRENLHIFWTPWGSWLKFSEKIWLMIILKVTKNQGFTLSQQHAILEKPQGGFLPTQNSLIHRFTHLSLNGFGILSLYQEIQQ